MSRVAKSPITVPNNVDVNIDQALVCVKGPKGALEFPLHPHVELTQEEKKLTFKGAPGRSDAMAGTLRALVRNMIQGVSEGFEKKLELVGVGYRAQSKGKILDLTLGFSHPVEFNIPEGITIETPSQTTVVVKGVDRQQVGQVAANIRAIRPPEPYKGKGVRYADEVIVKKEGKKK